MTHMKEACKHCPYRNDVKPFLRPDRGYDLAVHATNPYNSFTCHKTTVLDEDSEEGEMMCTDKSLECAGFITLQMNETGMEAPKGFVPNFEIIYSDSYDMIDAYDNPDDRDYK